MSKLPFCSLFYRFLFFSEMYSYIITTLVYYYQSLQKKITLNRFDIKTEEKPQAYNLRQHCIAAKGMSRLQIYKKRIMINLRVSLIMQKKNSCSLFISAIYVSHVFKKLHLLNINLWENEFGNAHYFFNLYSWKQHHAFYLFWAVNISLCIWGPLYTTLDKPCWDKAPSVRAIEPILEG